MTKMQGINAYHRELTAEEIQAGEHRNFIGGMWEEIGQLQFEFLLKMGLNPHHKLLDIGCGSLRGGVHFVNYLESGRYHGTDINNSLIEAGKEELRLAGLEHKKARLLVDDSFALHRFGEQFDFMVSISVFTHLPMNIIIRALVNAGKNLAPGGKYFASFFRAPSSAWLESLSHEPGGVVTHYDMDPFHYSVEEMEYMAELAGLDVEIIGNWDHPRDQEMVVFRRRS